jgi:hypothetical protein
MRKVLAFSSVVLVCAALMFAASPAEASHQWVLNSVICGGGAVTVQATHNGGPFPGLWIDVFINEAYVGEYEAFDDSKPVAAGNYTFESSNAALVDGVVVTLDTGDVPPMSATCGFGGPGLPAKRDLVLITTSTAVLDAPGGQPTGRGVYVCQTVFITETDASGAYGKAFVMGGWIPLSATFDVPENYGQPGGTPTRPDCVGK